MSTQTPKYTQQKHANTRVRHEIKHRHLIVKAIEDITPSMRRVILTGESLADFVSLGFDDHVKLLFAKNGESIRPPVITENGIDFGVDKPKTSDYTPRSYDNEQNSLTLDFVLHEAGIATDWAKNAKVGDSLDIAGPRGSMVIPMDFDGYVLIGDDTALPAIARRLEELPDNADIVVLAEVNSVADHYPLQQGANTHITWLHREGKTAGQADLFLDALSKLQLPTGDVHIWVATETKVAQKIRDTLFDNDAVNNDYIKATGYWQMD